MNKATFDVNKDKLEVVISRVFDASRERIWEVITDPKMIPHWWGPRMYKTRVETMDVRVGGKWRFISIDEEQGIESPFYGVYTIVDKPSVLADTFNFEPIGPGHELVETMTLEDMGDNKTQATSVSKYTNIQDLEGMVGMGMEGGARETWERLAEAVEKK